MLAPLILFVGALGFQDAPSAGTSTVNGRVVDAVTGAPLSRARVTISGAGRAAKPQSKAAQMLTTDGNGQFRVQLLPGDYTAQARRNGYVDTPAATVAFTTATGETPALTLKLNRQGVIAGRVVDEEGEPAVGVQVQALRWMRSSSRLRSPDLRPIGFSSTNDLGEFRLFGLAPGKYLVSAQARQSGPLRAQERQIYAEVYFPGVTDATLAQGLEVTPGSERAGIELRLIRVAVASVLGKVGPLLAPPAGAGAAATEGSVPERRSGANIHLALHSHQRVEQVHHAQPNAQGEFQFDHVPVGTYTLYAITQSPQDRRSARFVLEVGTRDITNVAVTLEPLPTLRGRIRSDDTVSGNTVSGNTVSGNTVSGNTVPGNTVPGNTVQLAAMTFVLDPKARAQASLKGRVDAQGQFEIANLEKLTYRPRLAGLPKGYYVKSVQLGSFDVAETLDASGGVAGEITVTLAKGTAELSGLVLGQDQKAAAGVLVLLLNTRQEVVLTQATNALGQFALTDLPPGDYRLAVVASTDLLADVEAVERLYREGQKVTLAPDARESRRLELR